MSGSIELKHSIIKMIGIESRYLIAIDEDKNIELIDIYKRKTV